MGKASPAKEESRTDPPWASASARVANLLNHRHLTPLHIRASQPSTNRRRLSAGAILLASLLAIGGYLLFVILTLPDAHPLANQNPERTALMQARENEAREAGKKPRHEQHWVPLSSIAPHAVEAVIMSEDASFYVHHGIDFDELKDAVKKSWVKGALGRGASTITMQLARNLWLSGERSLLRKAKEMLLSRRLEDALPKKRILALYLNVIEWGDGIYGIDAAARAHFGVSAMELSLAKGAILAAMLPAPRRWLPSRRPRILRTSSLRTIERLEQTGKITADEANSARTEIEQLVGSQPTDVAEESELPDEDR